MHRAAVKKIFIYGGAAVAVDIARLRRAAEGLPLAEASLRNISDELAVREYR
jgi:hypothetical protein